MLLQLVQRQDWLQPFRSYHLNRCSWQVLASSCLLGLCSLARSVRSLDFSSRTSSFSSRTPVLFFALVW
jgi:hypothetical protein